MPSIRLIVTAVVHRDVKPANHMLTPGGAKLLDFGLAKACFTGFVPTSGDSSPIDESASLTAEGMLVGTVAIWRRNNWRARKPTRPPTSSPLSRCCSRWSPAGGFEGPNLARIAAAFWRGRRRDVGAAR